MKTSEALRAVKPFLAKDKQEIKDGKEMFICFALENAIGRAEALKVQDGVIYPRLKPFVTAGGWLRGNGVLHPGYDEIQQWRHNWVDQLIVEYESIGR